MIQHLTSIVFTSLTQIGVSQNTQSLKLIFVHLHQGAE